MLDYQQQIFLEILETAYYLLKCFNNVNLFRKNSLHINCISNIRKCKILLTCQISVVFSLGLYISCQVSVTHLVWPWTLHARRSILMFFYLKASSVWHIDMFINILMVLCVTVVNKRYVFRFDDSKLENLFRTYMWDFVCPKVYATQCLWLRALGLIVHFILMLVWNSNSKTSHPCTILFLYLERGSSLWWHGQLSKMQGVISDSDSIV